MARRDLAAGGDGDGNDPTIGFSRPEYSMKKQTITWFLFTRSKETAYGTGGGKKIVSNLRVRHHLGEKYENENLG